MAVCGRDAVRRERAFPAPNASTVARPGPQSYRRRQARPGRYRMLPPRQPLDDVHALRADLGRGEALLRERAPLFLLRRMRGERSGCGAAYAGRRPTFRYAASIAFSRCSHSSSSTISKRVATLFLSLFSSSSYVRSNRFSRSGHRVPAPRPARSRPAPPRSARARRSSRWGRVSAVHLAPVSNSDHAHGQPFVFDPADGAVVPDPVAP